MTISERLTPALIKVGLEGKTKPALFEELLDLLVEQGQVTDRAAALRALLEREAKMSTGVGQSLALPHGKIAEAGDAIMALGVCTDQAGIDYDALDGKPVYVVLMAFAPMANPAAHIQTLAEVSRLFSIPGFMERIRGARTSAAVLDTIAAEE